MPQKLAEYKRFPHVNLASEIADASVKLGLNPRLHGEAYLRSVDKLKLDQYAAERVMRIAGPLIGLVAKIVERDGGPGIIGLDRVGMDGEMFKQYKLRSMKPDAEQFVWLPGQKPVDDPRVTRIGKFLRKGSFDEVPQFENVREGKMSLVGPRPREAGDFARMSAGDSDYADSYMLGRPGITGLEQINGRTCQPEAAVKRNTVEYAMQACIDLDLYILFQTPFTVISGQGAH